MRDLKGQALDQGKAVLLTNLMVATLRESGAFKDVYARSDLEAILLQMGEKQQIDPTCDTTKCMLEVGNALGADQVLFGDVGRLGSKYLVTLTVFDMHKSAVVNTRNFECGCTEDDFVDRFRGYALEVMGLETMAQREARLEAERRAKEEADRRDRETRAAAEARVKAEQEATARMAAERAAEERRAQDDAAAREQAARAAADAQRKAEELRKTLGMEFVRIPGGEFEMGTIVWNSSNPVHRVRISDFRMAKSEVTQAQWRAVMGSNPSNFQGCDDCPVEKVSWNDVQEFLRKANARTGLSVRLPTEAEWEYAAGGGAAHQKWAGTNNDNELGEYSWYNANAGGKTHPVCQKRPNQFGLFDMSGNVWEWCSDRWADDYSGAGNDNPIGPSTGSARVFRGGSWINRAALDCRVALRVHDDPGLRIDFLGFRLALSQ